MMRGRGQPLSGLWARCPAGCRGCKCASRAKAHPLRNDTKLDGGKWAAAASVNCTTWNRLKQFLLITDLSVVAAQELHIRGEKVAEADVWCRKNGWRALWAGSTEGEGTGTLGGAILTRPHIGLAPHPLYLACAERR